MGSNYSSENKVRAQPLNASVVFNEIEFLELRGSRNVCENKDEAKTVQRTVLLRLQTSQPVKEKALVEFCKNIDSVVGRKGRRMKAKTDYVNWCEICRLN